ncbi:unnamed protein product [Acanthoscelides obtectus]|uniref:Uncharacterized protein n=1 Tax=Acanthoscelides obtectus TaxID=200917 RepID=A0A9P0LD98_ACAOB|nr:unnamed protein product [Acanthoscelides obtectus]CAK1661247.1 hypothetical protein AOBTE_LOCUS22538 [Acanthoscelides obtectus]
MMCKCVVSFVYILGVVNALGVPFFDELMLEQGDDSALVESTARETRAVGPKDIGELLSPDHIEGLERDDSQGQNFRALDDLLDHLTGSLLQPDDDENEDGGEGQESKKNYEVAENTENAEARLKQSIDDFDDKFYGKAGDSDVKGAASEDDETEATYSEDEDSEEPAESSYSYSKGGSGGGSYKTGEGGEEKGDGGHSTSYSKGGSYSSSSGKSNKGGTGTGSGSGYTSGSDKGYGGESESYQAEDDY